MKMQMKVKGFQKHVIKGQFFPGDRAVFWSIFCAILGIVTLFQVIDNEFSDSLKFEEAAWCILGFWGLSIIFYWLTSSNFYFYELLSEKIRIKSFMTNYRKEIYYNNILKVNLYGSLKMSALSTNSIEFVCSENDKVKYYKYHSKNLGYADWLNLINKLGLLGIKCEDPNKEFFSDCAIK